MHVHCSQYAYVDSCVTSGTLRLVVQDRNKVSSRLFRGARFPLPAPTCVRITFQIPRVSRRCGLPYKPFSKELEPLSRRRESIPRTGTRNFLELSFHCGNAGVNSERYSKEINLFLAFLSPLYQTYRYIAGNFQVVR